MKKIFKLKFLLHRAINIIFYVVFLVIGFVLGLMLGGFNYEEVITILNGAFC